MNQTRFQIVHPFGLALMGFALSSTVAGCGESSAESFTNDYCSEFSTCCAQAGLPANAAQCKALFGAFLPASGYNSEAGDACISEVRANKNQPGFCDDPDRFTPSCENVFETAGSTGNAQPGESCTEASDCAPSAMGDVECDSDFVDGATVRRCQVRISGGMAGDMPCLATKEGSFTYFSGGDEWQASGYICDIADGVYCDSNSGGCVALSPIGGMCTSSFTKQCVDGAYCDTAEDMCAAVVAEGGPCTSFFDEACGETGYCDDATDTCAARRADGATCDDNDQCLSDQCVNGACEADDLGSLSLVFICGSN